MQTTGGFLGAFNLDSSSGDAAGNSKAEGIAFDGSVLSVVNDDARTVYKYQTTGAALGSFSYNFSGAGSDPRGITAANGQLYIVDDNRQVYAGTESGGFALAFTLPSANNDPQGITGFSP